MTENKTELLPCRCGGIVKIVREFHFYAIECENKEKNKCNFIHPYVYNSEKDLIKSWNARATVTPSVSTTSMSSTSDKAALRFNEPKCMICGYLRNCNNCLLNGDRHKAMFPAKFTNDDLLAFIEERGLYFIDGTKYPEQIEDAISAALQQPDGGELVKALERVKARVIIRTGDADILAIIDTALTKNKAKVQTPQPTNKMKG